jgi:HEAT repeat protein
LVIRASSGKEVDALVADLSSESAIKCDTAVARLTVIGRPAVDRLVKLSSNSKASAAARVAAFRALEGIGEPRALQPALATFAEPDSSIAVAALNTARVFLHSSQGVEALDRFIEVALDRRRSVTVRVAAIQALADLPEGTVKPVLTALRDDPDAEIRNVLQPLPRRAVVNPVQRLEAAAEGRLPGDPEALKSAIARSAASVPLSTLHQIVERIRLHEGSLPRERRVEWMSTRAATHVALAHRNSRLALYDLRETIESSRERVPVEFFAAVTAIGDTTCLEPIATAYARARDDWSRRQLADAFRAIIGREKLTRRHAVAKKIEKRWPGSWDVLISPERAR